MYKEAGFIVAQLPCPPLRFYRNALLNGSYTAATEEEQVAAGQ